MPLFKIQVFMACVSFSIVVPSIAPYLSRLGAPEYVLGVAVAVYSLGEMIGSTYFGRWMTVAIQRDPARGPRRALASSIAIGFAGSILYVVADSSGAYGPSLVVLARLLSGMWTGGKMVVEQTYIGEAASPERTTQITSEVGVYAVLGFVMGPTVGAFFAPLDFRIGCLRIDQYTAPGYFMALQCVFMFFATTLTFDPLKGYANPPSSVSKDGVAYGAVRKDEVDDEDAHIAPPDPLGLATLLVCFLAHFYSFAIQETITTPFVAAHFGWSQPEIDYLFAGVGLLSLVTSLLVAQLSKHCSDVFMLLVSLIFGFAGSIALIDEPLFPLLRRTRFLFGFALITIAFPFGRNVALAMFSKVLGPTPQGSWMGLMFVVGALPRCLGPSWSLYALRLSCTLFHQDCPPGGHTCLVFITNALLFAACLAMVLRLKRSLLPFEERYKPNFLPLIHQASFNS